MNSSGIRHWASQQGTHVTPLPYGILGQTIPGVGEDGWGHAGEGGGDPQGKEPVSGWGEAFRQEGPCGQRPWGHKALVLRAKCKGTKSVRPAVAESHVTLVLCPTNYCRAPNFWHGGEGDQCTHGGGPHSG